MAIAYIGLAVVFFIIFFIGIIGNSVVLFVLLRQRRSWSITTTYLFNLAVADSLFILIIPFWGHHYLNHLEWTFGTGMCKLAGVVTSVNMYASIFFLTAMSADRYMAVVHATSVTQYRTALVCRWVCLSVWSASLILSIPRLLYMTLRPFYPAGKNSTYSSTEATPPGFGRGNTDSPAELVSLTSTTLDPNQPLACTFFIPDYEGKDTVMGWIQFTRSMIGFVIPMTVICICYMRIVLTVRKKVISKRVRKDRVAKLAALVVAAFFVCWLPTQIMTLYSAIAGWWNAFYFSKKFFNAVYPFTIALAYANSCINPIAYAFTTTNFQENVKDMCNKDKSNRPYKMTLSHPAGHSKEGQNYEGHRNSHSRCSPGRCECKGHHHYTQAVQVHVAQQVYPDPKLQPREAVNLDDPSNIDESQSFSYYSCPAVMQGLGKMNSEAFRPCESIAEPMSMPAENLSIGSDV